ncbi:hypothetical protein ACWPM1_11360 [Tsuneonella sp. HG249]
MAMRVKPTFLGACALVSIAGAVGGATINTQPIQRAGIGSEMLPRTDFAFDPSDDGLPREAPPEHYAMNTPEGRIEVAELADRGLYSQQRFGWSEVAYEPPPPPAWPEPSGEWTTEVASAEPGIDQEPARPPEEMPREEPVNPRIIDVSAELASL